MREVIIYAVMALTVCLWAVLRGPKGAPFLGLAVFLNWAAYLFVMTQWSGCLDHNENYERLLYIGMDIIFGLSILSIIVIYKFGRDLFSGISVAYALMFAFHFRILGYGSHVGYHAGLNLAYTIELIALGIFMSACETKKSADDFFKWRTSHRDKNKRWHH